MDDNISDTKDVIDGIRFTYLSNRTCLSDWCFIDKRLGRSSYLAVGHTQTVPEPFWAMVLGDDVPANKVTTISSDKPNIGEGLLMKRHGLQIPGLKPEIKQRESVYSTIK
jgi:hypothetical protein